MKKITGFTLIELMIVVAIIGILTAVVYPSYRQHVIKSHRVDAERSLLELTQWMERFFTENGKYNEDTGGNAIDIDDLPFKQSPQDGSTVRYNITFSAGPTATSYALKATPTGGQADDTSCGALSIDSTGTKCILDDAKCSNSATTAVQNAVNDCW